MDYTKNLQKVVLVGEGRVGKTSIALRYCKNEYTDQQDTTINASYLEKQIVLPDDEIINIAIWDTAGQEKFRAIASMYYNDAECAIIVYDISYKESFDKVDFLFKIKKIILIKFQNQVKSWVKELQEYANDKIIICIAGNKSDLEGIRQIDKKQAEEFAKSIGGYHFSVSAKANIGIKEMFQYIGYGIYLIFQFCFHLFIVYQVQYKFNFFYLSKFFFIQKLIFFNQKQYKEIKKRGYRRKSQGRFSIKQKNKQEKKKDKCC
ncbi:hypothetical protein IMG5_201440 [Ichthyophthirius multifiliis]|uniref:Uncharacterized protein n=1 Tax=Ichthyophthirius multifiliis TaxID=5932 RepID=G0R5Z5_ICHMU|nr:hypothetical protein IMG5_201440 [Ichthyophthirius multifiliis]EGR27119.1 hypothetical protein IMG5_201440 [Ichthyophthirius multifiliis]|eukprot:XP_004024003.1 hypothetical protein IMG5_201440 [Ichthyophthirius multifiliis]